MERTEQTDASHEILCSLLEEARRISSFVDFQKKSIKWFLILSLVLFVIGGSATLIMQHSLQNNISSSSSVQREWDWWDVERDLRKAQPDQALKKALNLLEKMPDYYEGHLSIAKIYLVQGNLTQAEFHFQRAYNLLPLEEHKHFLEAVKKRREQENR